MQRDKIDHLMAEMGHLRRGHVDGMSAIAPIATELLREGNGRKGPLAAIESCDRRIRRATLDHRYLHLLARCHLCAKLSQGP